jgi:hypothetical protein
MYILECVYIVRAERQLSSSQDPRLSRLGCSGGGNRHVSSRAILPAPYFGSQAMQISVVVELATLIDLLPCRLNGSLV